ncbi:MAG: hypothetical protein NXY59_00225 [Aigarchaeota archaeon]|nr:hypothetical protein [Candidatus Pelearchaeum maunauluense]
MPEVEDKVKKTQNCTEKALDNHEFFYRVKTYSPEKILGRELSCLAIPKCYADKVMQLREKMKREDCRRKRELLARLKGYLISVPHYIIENDGRWDEELGLPIVGLKRYTYSPQTGLVKG